MDTAVDFWDAQRIGVGLATAAILLGSAADRPGTQLLLTAGITASQGDVDAVTEDGRHMVISAAVLASSAFRHLQPGQRVLASVSNGAITSITLSGQLVPEPR